MRLTLLRLISFCGAAFMTSCDRTDKMPEPQDGNVLLEFTNKVGTQPIVFNTQWYQNENGDSFTISKFNYYISNVKLNGSSSSYTEEESYHLIKEDDAGSHNVTMSGIAPGTYTAITFTIGVDSARNESGAQTGALDPANGMFWTWNTGYIMMKMEGNSPQSSSPGNALMFHPGGYSSANSVLRTVTINFPTDLVIAGNDTKHIHLSADVLELFKSPHTIDFSTMSTVMNAGPNGKMLADNYENMFTVTLVE